MRISNIKALIQGSYYQSNKSQVKEAQKSGTITIKRSFNASRTLAQLASARTKSQVSAVERMVRAQLPAMKKQAGSEEAVRLMKYVIQKANAKRMALSKEERLDNNRKVAKSANNKKQEARFKSELIKRRMGRKRKEVVDALNAPDVFDKKKYDTFTIATQEEKANSFDVRCDSFGAVAQANKSVGAAIDTLL
ncbi:hypothetical protein [Candidatus Galacturonibacter soehngenii]|uniref:Uncharacterized protein n=1 Tax=Candidatus Galacturonatibacter soehngenii TaxID=2307010 RepID=A0A7V7QN12_9FIRM|nr:hypothetical protein [Candidatus Galacturonibacter soehngenii]KAB1440161.1 hypothetical protein F7O84_07240 [Candidatus Galacturonibacter soehngenii]MBA4685995.1 hypothetical protein [Candidatus Galacturonibacter soehngenii]